ncbi:MAG: prepilin peptidase [Candidatus Saccharimonadales bacterium]
MIQEIIIVAVYSLALGSFINAWVWRQRQKDVLLESEATTSNNKDITQVNYSIVRGRSICTSCHHELSMKDLVPVISWILLKGRCRYCNNNISWQYPVVETTVMLLGVISFLLWPWELNNIVGYLQVFIWINIVGVFVALSVYDLKWYLLPNSMMVSLLILALTYQGLRAVEGVGVNDWLLNPLIGGVGAFIFFYILYLLSRGKWMGGGDVKLALVLGLILGSAATLVGLFLAFNIAAIASLIMIVIGVRSRKDVVPFGPFLMLGAWLALHFSSSLINWYLTIL